MKKLLMLLLVAVSLTSCYTTKTVTFADDEFVKVYDDVKGDQDELFLKSNEWLVGIFTNAKSVIQHSDKEDGVIIGKYLLSSIPYTSMWTGTTSSSDVYAIIDIRVKDNKARLAIKPNDYAYLTDGMNSGFTKEDAMNAMELLAGDFHQALKKQSVDF